MGTCYQLLQSLRYQQAGREKGSIESLEGYRAKLTNIEDWQVQEFVWAFLEGTVITPNYSNLTWELEAEDDDDTNLDEVEDAGNSEGRDKTGRNPLRKCRGGCQ